MVFKSQKAQLSSGPGRPGRGGDQLVGEASLSMLHAAGSPGEIKVKGSSPAKEEAQPLLINQRGWDRAKRSRRPLL